MEEKKKTPNAKYKQGNSLAISVRFYRVKNGDLIEWVKSQPETPGVYVRRLIREDMEKHKK